MDRERVITVLECLASGIDPRTGVAIPEGVFHTADTVRALFTAATLLKTVNAAPVAASRRKSPTLASAGTTWSSEEDMQLCREYDSRMTIAQIALQHGRTSGAITSRLVRLGKIDAATVKSRDRGARVVSPPAVSADRVT